MMSLGGLEDQAWGSHWGHLWPCLPGAAETLLLNFKLKLRLNYNGNECTGVQNPHCYTHT